MLEFEEQVRTKLESLYRQLKAELSEERITAGEGMGYSTHQADHASLAFEQAADLALRQNARNLLYEVERALKRLDDGEFGLCRHCQQPIDRARLGVIPYARYCIRCADQQQGG